MTAVARRLPPAARRAQITAAALELFAQRPEEEVGLEDLAAAAGVTRNLLYRYFDSRADLHRAALEEAIRRASERMDTSADAPLSSKLPRNVAMWLDSVEREDPATRLIFRAFHSQDPEVRRIAVLAREALTRGIAFNHLGTRDPAPAVLAGIDGYLSMCERLIDRWRDGDLDRAEIERVLAGVLPGIVKALAGRR